MPIPAPTKMKMKWIDVRKTYPLKEKSYKCICLGFMRPIWCKFKKGKNGPIEYSSDYFIHKKRCTRVMFWLSQ